MAQASEQRDRDAAHAAVGPGHQHLAAGGFHARLGPVFLQRHHAQHGGVARGADGHGFSRAQTVRQGHQPVALDPRHLRQTAPVRFTNAEAVEDDAVAGLPSRVFAGCHGTREIDARHQGEAAHHGRLSGDGQAVLVVEGGPVHPHRHVAAGGQLRLVEFGERAAVAGVIGLVDQQGFEHEGLLVKRARFRARGGPAATSRPGY
ncbi:hypothetical protein FQZ97_903770 [compost metagenome]